MEMTTVNEDVKINISTCETPISASSEESTKETVQLSIIENSESATAVPEDQISVASNKSTQETEIDIKEDTTQNIYEGVHFEASTSNANILVVRADISPEVSNSERSKRNTKESDPITRSPQHRNRRSLRLTSGLATIEEDIVVSTSADPQPSTSGLNNRSERPRRNDIYDFSEDSSLDDSLERLNQPFLIGVWNGPSDMNPSYVLLLTLGVIFIVLMGIYIQNTRPVFA